MMFMAISNNTQKKIIYHNLFRDYFFENFDVFFVSHHNERITILDEIWNKIFEHQENTIKKPEWNIISYVFEEKDNVEFFKGSEILILELPKPECKGEAYLIGLGVAHPPNVYSTIIPFYMLLEHIDETTSYYAEYKPNENDNFEYFYINKPIEPTMQSFIKAIIERINKFGFGISIPAENNGTGNETTYNVYQFFDRVEELDGFKIKNVELTKV